MVGQIVGPRKFLRALTTLEGSRPRVLGYVTLPIGLGGKLKAAIITHKGLDSFVRPHVSLQQTLPVVGFSAELTLERPRPDAFVLPLVILEVVLGNKAHLADFTHERLLALMLDTYVLIDASFVEHLVANRTLR